MSDSSSEANAASRPDTPQSFATWTDQEREILVSKLEEFRAGTLDSRRELLQSVYRTWKGAMPSMDIRDWKKRKIQIKNWFLNHGRKTQPHPVRGQARSWTWKRVAAREHKQQIIKVAEQTSGQHAGQGAFIGYFKKAEKEFVETISTPERLRMSEVAKTLNSQGLPADVQQRLAEKKGKQFLTEVCDDAFKRFGMRLVILENHYDTQDRRCWSIFDNNAALGPKPVRSFQEFQPDFFKELERVWGEEYTQYVTAAGKEGDSDMLQDPLRTGRRKPLMRLATDVRGYPLLPDPPQREERLGEQQKIIRSFLTAHYRLAAGDVEAIVPWKSIASSTSLFIDPHFLPLNFKFAEASRMNKNQAKALISFWRARQNDSDIDTVFQFAHFKTSKGCIEPAKYMSPREDDTVALSLPSRMRKKSRRASTYSQESDTPDSEWETEVAESDWGTEGPASESEIQEGKSDNSRELGRKTQSPKPKSASLRSHRSWSMEAKSSYPLRGRGRKVSADRLQRQPKDAKKYPTGRTRGSSATESHCNDQLDGGTSRCGRSGPRSAERGFKPSGVAQSLPNRGLSSDSDADEEVSKSLLRCGNGQPLGGGRNENNGDGKTRGRSKAPLTGTSAAGPGRNSWGFQNKLPSAGENSQENRSAGSSGTLSDTTAAEQKRCFRPEMSILESKAQTKARTAAPKSSRQLANLQTRPRPRQRASNSESAAASAQSPFSLRRRTEMIKEEVILRRSNRQKKQSEQNGETVKPDDSYKPSRTRKRR